MKKYFYRVILLVFTSYLHAEQSLNNEYIEKQLSSIKTHINNLDNSADLVKNLRSLAVESKYLLSKPAGYVDTYDNIDNAKELLGKIKENVINASNVKGAAKISDAINELSESVNKLSIDNGKLFLLQDGDSAEIASQTGILNLFSKFFEKIKNLGRIIFKNPLKKDALKALEEKLPNDDEMKSFLEENFKVRLNAIEDDELFKFTFEGKEFAIEKTNNGYRLITREMYENEGKTWSTAIGSELDENYNLKFPEIKISMPNINISGNLPKTSIGNLENLGNENINPNITISNESDLGEGIIEPPKFSIVEE